MFAELSSASNAGAIVPVPFFTTLTLAVIALVGISIAVRRFRSTGTLTFANASMSAATASFVIAAAFLAVATTGTVSPVVAVPPFTPASADNVAPPADGFLPIEIENLEGFQLPTK